MSEDSQNHTNEQTQESSIEDKLYNNQDAEAKAETQEEVKEQEPVKEEPVAESKEEAKEEIQYKIELEESVLEEAQLEEIANFAKEQGFSNELANKIAQRENALLSNFMDAQEKSHEKMVNDWAAEIEADKDFGREAFKDNVNNAHKVINRFASEEFKEILNSSGYGNHPELFKTFAKIGKAMANDETVFGGNAAPKEKTIEELFYGKQD